HFGGRLARAKIAKLAQQLPARLLVTCRRYLRLDARDLFGEQARAARRDEVRADRDRQLILGFLMFVVAFAAERYAHRLLSNGFWGMAASTPRRWRQEGAVTLRPVPAKQKRCARSIDLS